MRERDRFFLVMGVTYALITVHMVVVRALGGLEHLPLVAFGSCQYVPALVVIFLVPDFRCRMVGLLSRPAWRSTFGAWGLGLVILGTTILASWLAGHHAAVLDRALCLGYPLAKFVPDAFLHPKAYLVFMVLGAPILHLLNATGEEILWRGYLLDYLRTRLPVGQVALVNGFLWGIWHAPMIAIVGWDFPGQAAWGIVAITVSQMAWSVLLCELRLRTDSLWPCIALHATANALTIGLFDRLVDHHYNLLYSPWGVLGGLVAAVSALALFRLAPAPRPKEVVS